MISTVLPSPAFRQRLRVFGRSSTALTTSLAIALGPITPAFAEPWTPTVVATEGYGTRIEGGPGFYDVNSGIQAGSTAVNVFDRFTVRAEDSVNLNLGDATRLVNIMAGDEGVLIDGMVRASSESLGERGGDVYFVTPGGFVLGAGGSINVGALTVSTASHSYRDALMAAALGGGFETAAAALYAGSEALNPEASIEVLGHLEARRLSLRAGARLVLDGAITVSGEQGGEEQPYSPTGAAVNTSGMAKAAGASVGADGVIRLHAGGDINIGSSEGRDSILQARGGAEGGRIEASAGGDLNIFASNSLIVAGASEADQPGLIVMLAEGTARVSDAVRILAEGRPGSHGSLSITADTLEIEGAGALGGAESAVTLAAREEIRLSGEVSTDGASVQMDAPEIRFEESSLHTQGGHVFATGQRIEATDAVIDTTGEESSGLILLRAEADARGSDWPISVKDVTAEVRLTGSTLTGGAVVVTAVARSGNGEADSDAQDRFAEGLMDDKPKEAGDSGFDLVDTLAGLLDKAVEAAGGGPLGAAQIAAANLPLNVPVSLVDARVTITDSTLNADGRLTATPAKAGTPLLAVPKAPGLGEDGLEESRWTFTSGDAGYAFDLPKGWAPGQGIYLQSHAENTVTVKPGSLAPAIGVAVMDTRSRLEVDGSSSLFSDTGISAFSTVHEKLEAEVSGGKVADVSAAVLVTHQNVENQLLVDAARIQAGGYADFAALTQRSHSATVSADAGRKGFVAVAVNLGISNSRTEAAINARDGLQAARVLATAETLWLENTRATRAEMGMDDPGDLLAVVKEQYTSKITDPLKNAVKRILLRPHEGEAPPEEKDSLGLGFAVDVNVMNDDTRVSLGGSYYDGERGAQVAFRPGSVTSGDAVDVAATLRYASAKDRILNGPRRSVTANMGSVGSLMQSRLDAMNKALAQLPGTTPVKAKDLQGSHDTVLMGAANVTLLSGSTLADLGGTVSARALSVNALTDYSSPLQSAFSLQQQLLKVSDYIAATAKSDGVEEGEPAAAGKSPEMPDLKALLTNLGDLNSVVSAKAGRSTLADNDPLVTVGELDKGQEMAAGLAVNMFSTQHTTRASLRDGAMITLTGGLAVNAFDRGILFHATNFPPDPTTLASGASQSAIGGTLNVVRRASDTRSEIGRAVVQAGTLTLDARSQGYQGLMHFAGGGAAGDAINLAFGGGIMTNTTRAGISGGAQVDLSGDALVRARDDSGSWTVAGGLSKGTGAAVGAALAVNFASRETVTDVGAGARLTSTAGAVTLQADDKSVDIAAAVAGSAKTASKPEPDAWAEQDDDDSLVDMIINPLLGKEEADYLTGFLAFGTTASEETGSQKTGLAVSGAAALNLMLGNTTKVSIGRGATVTGARDVTALAQSNAVMLGVTGAVSLGLDPSQDTNAIAGSLNWSQGHRNVLTQVSGTLVSGGGNVALRALDDSSVVNVAVGGAGASRGNVVIAGSVAGNMLHGTTAVQLTGATLRARNALSMQARDRALQVAIGGGIGLNFGKGLGMGLGVATNTYNRSALVQMDGLSRLEAATVTADAEFRARIYALGISAGLGKTGVAGSVTVNTILAGAKVSLAGRINTGALVARSVDHGEIWTIAGSVALSTGNAAVGAAAAVNTVVTDSGVALSGVTFEERARGVTTDVTLEGRASTKIRSLAAAGAVAKEGLAVGAGITVNTVRGANRVKLENSTLATGGTVALDAKTARDIAALGGGAAGVGKGVAAGAGLAVNTITGNDTDALLIGGTITSRNLRLEAEAASRIRALAAGLGGGAAAVAGSVTVNVISGLTRSEIRGGRQNVTGTIVQTAADKARIDSIAGSVAGGGKGFGLATAVNIIAQDTEALSDSTFTGNLTLRANNLAQINALAAAAAGGGTAAGLSVAVGDIGNSSRAILGGSSRRLGNVTIEATNDSEISILSGTAAGGAGAGVGAAVTLAMIHDGTLAQIAPGALSSAGTVSVNALRRGSIDALAASGAAGGTAGVAGSLVFTMIGREARIEGLDTALEKQGQDDPVAASQARSKATSDQVMRDLRGQVAGAGSDTLNSRIAQGFAKADDQTRADVVLGAGQYGAVSVNARDESAIRSLAGGAAAGGAAGLATGVTVNLMLGATSSRLALMAGGTYRLGAVNVTASQISSIRTAAFAAGGGAGVGGGAAVSVNVMQRDLLAEVTGNGSRATANSLLISARQHGAAGQNSASDITNITGVAAIGGVAAGGAIAVNYASDRVRAQTSNLDLTSTGDVTVLADSRLNLTGTAAALSVGAGSFSGNFVVNVGTGTVLAGSENLTLRARNLTLQSEAQRRLVTNAGGFAAGGTAVGASVAVNVNSLKAQSRHAGLAVQVSQDALIAARGDVSFGGVVVQGAAALNAAVAGSAVANRNLTEVSTALTGTEGRQPLVLARGNLALRADGAARVTATGGASAPQSVNAATAVGLVGAGVSVTVNLMKASVKTEVSSGALLAGLGLNVARAALGMAGGRGVAISANSDTLVTGGTYNLGAGAVGLSAVTSTVTVADDVRVVLGTAGSPLAGVQINDEIDPEYHELAQSFTAAADARQDLVITAGAKAKLETDAAALSFGAFAGAGAAVSVSTLNSSAQVVAEGGTFSAARHLDIGALSQGSVAGNTLGTGGGFVGMASTTAVHMLEGRAKVQLGGAALTAGSEDVAGNLSVRAATDMTSKGNVGSAAGGVVAGVGAVRVTNNTSEAEVSLGAGVLNASGNVTLAAGNDLELQARAASGSAGLFAAALATNIVLARTKTAVDLGANGQIMAGADLKVSSENTTTIASQAGVMAVSGLGSVGAGLDVHRFASEALVRFGDNSHSTAGGLASLTVRDTRDITSTVVSGAAGGLLGISAAISALEVAGKSVSQNEKTGADDRANLLASAQGAVSAKSLEGGADARANAGRTGGLAERDAAAAKVAGLDITGSNSAARDIRGIALGTNARIQSGKALTLLAENNTNLSQVTGAAGAGFAAGAASGLGLVFNRSGAEINLGARAALLSGGALTVSARDGGEITSRAHTIATSGFVGAGTGVVRAESAGAAHVLMGQGVTLDAAGAGSVLALRDTKVTAEVQNVTMSGAYGVGAAVARVVDSGTAAVALSGSRITAASLDVTARNASRNTALATASAGGVIGAGNGVDAGVSDVSKTRLTMENVTVSAGDVTLAAKASASASATARGRTVAGGVALGVSLAKTTVAAEVTTKVTGQITSTGNVSILSELTDGGAKAVANGSAGGLLAAGVGARAEAWGDYTVSAVVAGTITAQKALAVRARTENFAMDASGIGKSGALLAVGAVVGRAGQSAGKSATVLTDVSALRNGDVLSAGGRLSVEAVNNPLYRTKVEAGAYGLAFTGAAAQAETTARLVTRSDYGTKGANLGMQAADLQLSTVTGAQFESYVDSRSASLVGVSGANQKTSISLDQGATLGGSKGGVTLVGQAVSVRSDAGLTRGLIAGQAHNLRAGSGGLVGVSSANSEVNVSQLSNQVSLGANSLINALSSETALKVAAQSRMTLADRLYLDANGAIANPHASGRMVARNVNTNVSLTDAMLLSAGDMRVTAGTNSDLQIMSNANSTGLAASASAFADIDLNANQKITVNGASQLRAGKSLQVLAGYGDAPQVTTVLAESRVYNKTAVPIKTNPRADAKASGQSTVDLGRDSTLSAMNDVALGGVAGSRRIIGYGEGTDAYREVLAEIANFFGGLFGAEPVSLKIVTGTHSDTAAGNLVVNGTVRAGVQNIQAMIFDENNALNLALGGYKAGDIAVTAAPVVRTGAAAAKVLRDRVVALEQARGVSGLSASAKAAIGSELARVKSEILRVERDPAAQLIELGDIRASAGNVMLYGDAMAGTGTLTAPGIAKIDLQARSGAILAVGNLLIDDHAGGAITFNDVRVRSNRDIQNLTGGRSAGLSTTLVSTEEAAQSHQMLVTANRDGRGTVIFTGDAVNAQGLIRVRAPTNVSIYGSLMADVIDTGHTETVDLGYVAGIRHASGTTPQQDYQSVANTTKDLYRLMRGVSGGGKTAAGMNISTSISYGVATSLGMIGRTGGLLSGLGRQVLRDGVTAGRTIYISGDAININATISAGRGGGTITIGEGADQILAGIKGTQEVLIWDGTARSSDYSGLSGHISSDVSLFWNPVTQKIRMADIEVIGGNIEINGDIFSTGAGKIEVLDGYSAINVRSQSANAIDFGRVVAAGSVDAAGNVLGVKGRVVLNDATAQGGIRTTVYERELINGTPTMVVRSGLRSAADVDAGRDVVLTLQSQTSANGGRSGSYQTKLGRDYRWEEAQDYTRTYVNRRDVKVGPVGKEKTKRHYEAVEKRTYTPGATRLVSSGLVSRPSGATYGSTSRTWTSSERLTSVSGETRVYNNVKVGIGWRHYDSTYTFRGTQNFETRVKADHAVAIAFTGLDEGGISLFNRGGINLTGEVLSAGTATLTSQAGDITSGNAQGVINARTLNLLAQQGRIGSDALGLQVFQAAGGAARVSATARDSISLQAARSGLAVDRLTTTATSYLGGAKGAITVSARGDLTGATAAGSARQITGNDITLTSSAGAITGLNLTQTGLGSLRAEALNDISLTVPTGNLAVREVVSSLGNVTLAVPQGRIFDANEDGLQDFRTTDELKEQWRSLTGLTNAGSERFEALVAQIATDREQLAQAYWAARADNGGTPVAYKISADERAALRDAGRSDREINALEADRATFWSGFDGQSGPVADYRYTVTTAEREALRRDALWSEDLLLTHVPAAMVRRFTSNVTENEAPNISAWGNITLTALTGIGRNDVDYVIDTSKPLTREAMDRLAAALTTDVIIDRAKGTLSLRQFDDLNFAQTGRTDSGAISGALTARVTDPIANIFLGTAGAARISRLEGARTVLRADGDITSAGTGVALKGIDLVLQSRNGAIGTETQALRSEMRGEYNLRAEAGINVSAVGDMKISEVFSRGKVTLSASHQILDTLLTGAARIVAQDIVLRAQDIGGASGIGVEGLSERSTLQLNADRNTRVRAENLQISGQQTAGTFSLEGIGRFVLGNLRLQAGQMELHHRADLNLSGAKLDAENLLITAAGAVKGVSGDLLGRAGRVSVHALGGGISGADLATDSRLRLVAAGDVTLDLAKATVLEAVIAGGNVAVTGAAGLDIGVLAAAGGSATLTAGGPVQIGVAGAGSYLVPELATAGAPARRYDLAALDTLVVEAKGQTIGAGLIAARKADIRSERLDALMMGKDGALTLDLATREAILLVVAEQGLGAVSTSAEQAAALAAIDRDLRDNGHLESTSLTGAHFNLRSQGKTLQLAGLNIGAEMLLEQGSYRAQILAALPQPAEGEQPAVDPELAVFQQVDPSASLKRDEWGVIRTSGLRHISGPRPGGDELSDLAEEIAKPGQLPGRDTPVSGQATDWNGFADSLSQIPLTLGSGEVPPTSRQIAARETVAALRERIRLRQAAVGSAGATDPVLAALLKDLAAAEAELSAADRDAGLTPEQRAAEAEAARVAEAEAEAARAAAEAADREARQKADSERAAAERQALEAKQAAERAEIARAEAARAEAARVVAAREAQRVELTKEIAALEAQRKGMNIFTRLFTSRGIALERQLRELKSALQKL